jgi:hypothetical protein
MAAGRAQRSVSWTSSHTSAGKPRRQPRLRTCAAFCLHQSAACGERVASASIATCPMTLYTTCRLRRPESAAARKPRWDRGPVRTPDVQVFRRGRKPANGRTNPTQALRMSSGASPGGVLMMRIFKCTSMFLGVSLRPQVLEFYALSFSPLTCVSVMIGIKSELLNPEYIKEIPHFANYEPKPTCFCGLCKSLRKYSLAGYPSQWLYIQIIQIIQMRRPDHNSCRNLLDNSSFDEYSSGSWMK